MNTGGTGREYWTKKRKQRATRREKEKAEGYAERKRESRGLRGEKK